MSTPAEPETPREQARRLRSEARKAEEAERLAAYIRKVVDAAPPLTDEQCASIAALLRGYGRRDSR